MRKRDQETFVRKANKLIKRYGGVPVKNTHWTLETKYGHLVLEVEEVTVFARFEDAERAHRHTGCQRYTGRWDHQYLEPWTVKKALADLKSLLKKVTTGDTRLIHWCMGDCILH
jgi:hypothetical protein